MRARAGDCGNTANRLSKQCLDLGPKFGEYA